MLRGERATREPESSDVQPAPTRCCQTGPLRSGMRVLHDPGRAELAYQRVARSEDVPDGRGLCVQVDGIAVGLFRVAGQIHAIENACPHAGDPLSEGMLDGAVVTCAAHGWEFDVRTGFRPEDGDGFPIPRFAVQLANGWVEVDIDSPLPPARPGKPPSRT